MGRIVNADGQEVIQAVFTDVTDIKQLELGAGKAAAYREPFSQGGYLHGLSPYYEPEPDKGYV